MKALEKYLGIGDHLISASLLFDGRCEEGNTTYLELDGDRLRLLPLLGVLGIVSWNRKWTEGSFHHYLIR